jgi:hypothetical protein
MGISATRFINLRAMMMTCLRAVIAPACPAAALAYSPACDSPAYHSPMRPIPTYPRGPIVQPRRRPSLWLECPRISPEWELAAKLALVKPRGYTREKIAHSTAVQPWPRGPRGARRTIEKTLSRESGVGAVCFGRGPMRLRVELPAESRAAAMRVARRLSRALPALWFVIGETYLRDGVIYQRAGKYKLELVRATRVRLRRSVRMGFLEDLDAAIAVDER